MTTLEDLVSSSLDSDQNPVCCICGSPLNVQSHHVRPIHLGGDEDGLQVNLCGNCHSNVHRMAENLRSKGDKKLLFDTNHFERAKPLIQAILDSHNIFESQPQSNKPRRRMFVLHIGDVDWVKLHKVKTDKGYTSMTKFLTDLLMTVIKAGE